MRSSRRRNRALVSSRSGVGARRFGPSSVRELRGCAWETPLVMLVSRCLALDVGCATAGSWISAQRCGYLPHPRRRAEHRRGVINVLRHDLPTLARRANISSVERQASYSRGDERVRHAVPVNAGCPTVSGAITVFIDSGMASEEAQPASAFRALQPSALLAVGPLGARQVASFCAGRRGSGGFGIASFAGMY
jgi:hypothetical protein